MGCVDRLPWERVSYEALSLCKEPLFALELGGVSLEEFAYPPRGILILGSEEVGVSPECLALADRSSGRVSIPLYGWKGSLNVSVAYGILMSRWAGILSA